MFDVKLMRRNGVRLTREEADRQLVQTGEFHLDVANGAKRLRIKNPWSGGYALRISIFSSTRRSRSPSGRRAASHC